LICIGAVLLIKQMAFSKSDSIVILHSAENLMMSDGRSQPHVHHSGRPNGPDGSPLDLQECGKEGHACLWYCISMHLLGSIDGAPLLKCLSCYAMLACGVMIMRQLMRQYGPVDHFVDDG